MLTRRAGWGQVFTETAECDSEALVTTWRRDNEAGTDT